MDGIRLFLKLIKEVEKAENRLKQSGEQILDTAELLKAKITIAELLVDLNAIAHAEGMTDEEAAQITDMTTFIRERYKIQSGIYIAAEVKKGARKNENSDIRRAGAVQGLH